MWMITAWGRYGKHALETRVDTVLSDCGCVHDTTYACFNMKPNNVKPRLTECIFTVQNRSKSCLETSLMRSHLHVYAQHDNASANIFHRYPPTVSRVGMSIKH